MIFEQYLNLTWSLNRSYKGGSHVDMKSPGEEGDIVNKELFFGIAQVYYYQIFRLLFEEIINGID